MMTEQPDIRRQDLPESIADIVKAIGIPATLKLAARFGGTRIYWPRPLHITEDHVIALTIGVEAARAVAKLYEGERLTFPRAVRALLLARDRAIRREARRTSVRKLALKYHLTERGIYLILNRADIATGDGL